MDNCSLVKSNDSNPPLLFTGFTALHYAAENNNAEVIHALTKRADDRGKFLEIRCKHGQTALFHAAKSKKRDAVKALLEQGANPFSTNSKSLTPVDVAPDEIKKLINEHTKKWALKDKLDRALKGETRRGAKRQANNVVATKVKNTTHTPLSKH